MVLYLVHTIKKGHVLYSCICGALDKYQVLYWVTARLTDWGRLTGILGNWHSCHECWDRHSLSRRGLFPKALTLSRGARFISWCLRPFFLEKRQQGSRHFLNCQACVGYNPVSGSHTEKGHVLNFCIWWALDKYQVLHWVKTWLTWLGHTSAEHVDQDMWIKLGVVLALVTIIHGHLTWIQESRHSWQACLYIYLYNFILGYWVSIL